MSSCITLQKNGRYLFRRAVPVDIRNRVEKREWKKSLGVVSHAEARMKAAELFKFTEREIKKYRNPRRNRISSSFPTTTTLQPYEEFLAALDRWLKSMTVIPNLVHRSDMHYFSDKNNWGQLITNLQDELKGLENVAFPDIYIDPKHLRLDEIKDESGYTLELSNSQMLHIKKAYKQARITSIKEQIAFLHDGETPLLNDFTLGSPDIEHTSLSMLLNEYERFKKNSWSPKTRSKFEGVSKEVIAILGAKTNISSIDRAMCNNAVRIMEALPANYSKMKSFKGLSLPEIADKAKANGLEGRNPKTIKAMVTWFTSFFKFAEEEQLIASSPAKGLKVTRKAIKGKRNPFENSELSLIFSAPLYTGCVDDDMNWRKQGNVVPKRSKYWVPIIALHSGIRLNEICQLQHDNIQLRPEGAFFSISESDGKELKTKNASRIVPVHNKLIELGFLDWVSSTSKNFEKSASLFPELTNSTSPRRPSDNFSRWFSRFRDSIGLEDSGKSFHSFRHYFTDRLTEQGIRDQVINRLMGWSTDGMFDVYGKGPSLKELSDAINKTEIFDLSMLSNT